MLAATVFTLGLLGFASAAPMDSALTVASRNYAPLTTPPSVTNNGKCYYHRGCYDELEGGLHALTVDVTASITGDFTVEACVAVCASKNYLLAGVMNGNTCACDNAIAEISVKLDDGQCNNACTGAPSEACGGESHYDIYYTDQYGSLPYPTCPSSVGSGDGKYTSMGCWKDDPSSRTLNGDYYRGNDVTPTQCSNYCYQKGFRLAAVEFGQECFCGQELLNLEYAELSDCNQACVGDSTQTCGAANRLNVYYGIDKPDVLRAEVIVGTDLLDQYISIGCYSDSNSARALTGYTYSANDMTASICAAVCLSKGFIYAGVELGTDCFCGNSLPDNAHVDASYCDTPCGGDSLHSCGGGLRLDVYESLHLGLSVSLNLNL